jgi:probable HAF family extracellular repeat protein
VGTSDVYATGVNNAGQIVGHVVDADGFSHAALWSSNGAFTPLPELKTADPFSEAYRINNSGQIVGKSKFDASYSHAVIWNAGSVQDIGLVPGGTAGSFANDINDNGVVAGASSSAHGLHAFTWTSGGGIVDWGSFNSNSNTNFAGWNAISNNGVMAGTAYVLFSPYKASMARPGDTGITNISVPGQFSTGMALAINNSDVIVGYQSPGSGGSPHPAIFNGDGTFQDLGTLGFGEGWAEDINDNGVIVGRVMGLDQNENFVQNAFVYQDGQQYDLLSLLNNNTPGTGGGWTQLFSGSGINDNGTIVGTGVFNGVITGFMVTPTPEPATVSAIGVTSLMLVSRRRRRA